jgi:hypothetical protein
MTVHYLKDYSQKKPDKRPREITFCSPTFNLDGSPKTINVSVRVENGDAAGILAIVIEDGGVGHMRDEGVYEFVPWPCAAVLIRDL